MDYVLVLNTLLVYPILIHAEIPDINSSLTKATWFWPVLGICLALLLSIPCSLLTIIILWQNKKHSGDSDGSSVNSRASLSSTSTHVQQGPSRNRDHFRRSYYAGGFRSPPPPYVAHEQPERLFLTPSLPPPYESHLPRTNTQTSTTTVGQVEPAERVLTQSSDPAYDASSTLTNPSLQTFQV
ncbi:unnamed protein product [Adineta ricciae]|uniref:Uncharacterized protein n=1 Tax=Adineta ricciae TaxID=249248 RepID=A0A816F1K4_ADIRI|nr:unnamed protein product [Adineta ricciae]